MYDSKGIKIMSFLRLSIKDYEKINDCQNKQDLIATPDIHVYAMCPALVSGRRLKTLFL